MPDQNEDSTDELEARAKLLEAEAKLTMARYGFVDRIVMRGVIPIALAIAAPIATFYFSQRAETGLQEVRNVGDSIKQLDQMIDRISKAAERHDGARAQELDALKKLVSSLQWTIVVQQVREVVQVHGRPALRTAIERSSRPDFTALRAPVERMLFARIAPHVDADPVLVRESIQGAIDEIAPEFEAMIEARGSELHLPNEPRYPTKQSR